MVVDDYRLAVTWEQCLANSGYKMLAIDDLRREHVADMLLEPKLTSSPEVRHHKKESVLLTGPRYLLLDPAYSVQVKHQKDDCFVVLMSLGGGGDLQFLHDCMQYLIEEVSDTMEKSGFVKLILKPVLGPMGLNTDSIRQLALCYPNIIFPLEKPENIASHYQQANLFVGAAGTSIYEAAASKVPAITFSLAENQCNNVYDLEQLGHYLHINQMPADSAVSLALLIAAVIKQHSRLESLRSNAEIVLDGKGTSRVAHLINEHFAGNRKNSSEKASHCAQYFKKPGRPEQMKRGNELSFRPCEDTDVNRYLHARNLPANRCNMTTDVPIHPLDHYRWWFLTKRQSYAVVFNEKTVLYIWHEAMRSEFCNFLVGGWFTTSENIDPMCVVNALDWQLKTTDEIYQGIPWVAIIKKTNRFVYKLNQRAGFKNAAPGSSYHKAISDYFGGASPEVFHYVYRDTQSVELGNGQKLSKQEI
ncbi:hypothetical protein OAM69_06045 [bacterium]|nr:hypothetical protein [bacterium]